jgi:hypothetical protein
MSINRNPKVDLINKIKKKTKGKTIKASMPYVTAKFMKVKMKAQI